MLSSCLVFLFCVNAFVVAFVPSTNGVRQYTLLKILNFLEKEDIPINIYKKENPFVGRISSVTDLVKGDENGHVKHVVIEHKGKMPFVEGQSIGVIPSPTEKVRLYSISSSRYGDTMDGNTVSLCIRRAVTKDPISLNISKTGICSNFLCDSCVGDEINLIGPCGKTMILPDSSLSNDIIMVGTGTGVAPYRGFMKRLFFEKTNASQKFKSLAWMILGFPNSDSILYKSEWDELLSKVSADNLRISYALSRDINVSCLNSVSLY
eukprot:GHVL01003861.1.p2 GENE.GHVL01003861.1~~GHVL01003861.1.p2  ORF type:complete len:264 (-),score=40.08 GHVL01003861.1:1189-1980(-)